MQTELEKTQLEIAKLQLEQERHKLGQMKKRQRVVDDLGSGAAAVGGAAAKGAGMAARGGGALLRYLGRYVGWVAEFSLIVCGAYLLAAYWSKQSSLTFAQRIDYLLDLPGSWGAFLIFVVPLIVAPRLRPFSGDAGASALRIVAIMGFLIFLTPRTSLLP